MKPVVKQKLSTLQDIINNAQSGGGGADSYTKAEADAKFETKTNAASTYLSKTAAANMVNKKSAEGVLDSHTLDFKFTDVDLNSLNNSIVIFILKNDVNPEVIPLMCILYIVGTLPAIYESTGHYNEMLSVTFNSSQQALYFSIGLIDDFQDVFGGTATIIY